MPKITALQEITKAHGVTVAQLIATYGHRPETLRRWATVQPATVIALIAALKAGAVSVPIVASKPADQVARIRRKAAQRRYYQKHKTSRTREQRQARHQAREQRKAQHLAEVARLLAWSVPARAWPARKVATAAHRLRLAGGLVSSEDVRGVLAGQGWRCAYCGHPHGLQVRRIDYQAEPDAGNLIGLCQFHGQDRGNMPDREYRKQEGIPAVTKWDGI